jgi:hypothetical protein
MVHSDWPELSEARDGPTIGALHLFSQIVGKIAVAALPWRNHGWHLTMHMTPRGFRTEPIHVSGASFELLFDLSGHALLFESTGGLRLHVPIRPMSVAAFHSEVLAMLKEAEIDLKIHGRPNEIDPSLPFVEDQEIRAYDPVSAQRLHRALLAADRVFRMFRSSFLGKVSPVHFFWGSFDLAVTRFSGRIAPRHPGGIPHLPDAVTREAYSHEVSSAGFWPGGANGGTPLFYSYAYPSPEGFREAQVKPEEARFDGALGEFVLDYEEVRTSSDPDGVLLTFLDSTYAVAADLGGWDRARLECEPGRPGVPRAV